MDILKLVLLYYTCITASVTCNLQYLGTSLSNVTSFHYSNDSVTWVKANDNCGTYGMKLVEIDDADENANIVHHLNIISVDEDDAFWIDVRYRESAGTIYYCCYGVETDTYQCGKNTTNITWTDLTKTCGNMSIVRKDKRISEATTNSLNVSTFVLHPMQWETHWPNAQPVNYTNWSDNSEHDSVNNFAAIQANGLWIRGSKRMSHRYICQQTITIPEVDPVTEMMWFNQTDNNMTEEQYRQKEKDNNLNIIIGSCCGGIVLVIIIVIATSLLCRRYRQRPVSQKILHIVDTTGTKSRYSITTGNASPPDAQRTESTPEYAVPTGYQMRHNQVSKGTGPTGVEHGSSTSEGRGNHDSMYDPVIVTSNEFYGL